MVPQTWSSILERNSRSRRSASMRIMAILMRSAASAFVKTPRSTSRLMRFKARLSEICTRGVAGGAARDEREREQERACDPHGAESFPRPRGRAGRIREG